MRELFEELREEINGDLALADQEVVLDNYKYYFEEVEEGDWVDNGKYAHSYTVYRVSKWALDGEHIDDLDLLIKQDCTRTGSYYSYYEFYYESIYMVEKREKTIIKTVWVAI